MKYFQLTEFAEKLVSDRYIFLVKLTPKCFLCYTKLRFHLHKVERDGL